MSFESDGQGPAGDERLGDQLGRGSANRIVQHEDVVELGSSSSSSSESSQSNADGGLSAEEASSAEEAADSSEDSASVSQESAAESPPDPSDGGPDEDTRADPQVSGQYLRQAQYQYELDGSSADLYGLASHALASAAHDGPEVAELDPADAAAGSAFSYGSESSAASNGSYPHQDEKNDYRLAGPDQAGPDQAEPGQAEPVVEEPESGLQIEELPSNASETSYDVSSQQDTRQNAGQPPPAVEPQQVQVQIANLEEVRESIRSEARSRIRALEAEVHRLESAEWELRRKLNDASLQSEAAQAERERIHVSAAMHETELHRLRASMEQLRSQHEARVVELRAAVDEQRSELEAQRRAHDVLRDRFAEQSGFLADSRAAVAELERARVELESQTNNARRAEQRAQMQLGELREELDSTLGELANVRAELTLQTQMLAEVRAQAREEALEELLPESTNDDESIWRERYVDLRRQMDAVASEFERREPEILALQREHAEAEARTVQAQDSAAQARAEKNALERKLRAADRRASDLLMEQQLTEQLIADLRRQVLNLLTDKMLSTSGDTPLSPEDEEELAKLRDQVARDSELQNDDVDGQTLISERLLLFKDVAELQFQNEALLKACRGLAKQLDPDGDVVASAAAASSQRSSADELREAADALEALEKRFAEVQAELEEARRSAATSQTNLGERNRELEAVRAQLMSAEGQVADLRRRLAVPEPASNGPPQDLTFLRLELQTERTRLSDTERQLNMARDEASTASKRLKESQIAVARAEQKIAAAEAAAADARGEADQAHIALSALRSEKALWAEREQRLMSQVSAAQAEAAEHARNSGASQSRQADLEFKLIGTMERLETLVASSSGDARAVELQQQLEAAESRGSDLQSRITQLEGELSQLRTESSTLQGRFAAVSADLEAAKKHAESLSTELSSSREYYESERAKFQKRDDDLVEQVNNLEDSLTEAREKLRVSEESVERERNTLDESRRELDATMKELQESRENLGLARKELETVKDASKDSVNVESLRRDVESQVRAEVEKALRTEIEASLRSQVEGTVRPDIEASVRSEVESALKAELESSARNEIEASVRAELEPSLRSELKTSLRSELESVLRPELEASIRAELGKVADKNESTSPEQTSVQPSEEELRVKIEAELRERLSKESAPAKIAVPADVQPLFDDLSARASAEEVEQFQQAVLAAEQARVKTAFRKKLDDVREAAENDAKTKVAEAEKRAEEKATKRAEMRTKLQTQKLAKLEERNKELEAQVEEMRNKVRRLKGGATDGDSQNTPSPSAIQAPPTAQGQQQQQQQMQQPFMPLPMTHPFANFSNSSSPFQFSPMSSPFGVDQTQKRQSFFPDNVNQKKRKEEERAPEGDGQQ